MLSQIPTHLHLRGLPVNPRTQESWTPQELSAKPPPHGQRPASPSAGSWACPPSVSGTACTEGTGRGPKGDPAAPGRTPRVITEVGPKQQLLTHQMQSKHVIFSPQQSTKKR